MPGSYSSGGTASAAVTAGSYDSGTGIATLTVANSFAPGQEVVVTGVSPGGYNGTFSVTSATSTTISYSPGTSLGSWSSGGTVSLPMPGTASCGGATVSVCYSYDAENNRTQMMDGTGTTNYSYDAFGETTSVHNPTGPTTTCDDGTNTTCYGYDSDGNATSVTYPLPTSTVTNATWSSGTATITAANGFTSGQTVYVSGVNPSGYNGTFTVLAAGLSSSQFEYSLGTNPGTYSSGGTATWWETDAVGITYDAADQPTAVSDFSGSTSPYAISVAMDANGQITSTSLGSTYDTITPSYQDDSSISSLVLKNISSTTLESFGYQYGPDGSDVSETDTGAGISGTVSCNGSTVTTCNSFDQGTRLGSATTNSNHQSYAADADSNSWALPELQGTTSQPAATYDGSDELTSSTQSGTTTNYVYDGDGQLSSETQGSAITVTSVPDAAGNIIAYNDTNTTANTGANMSSATYDGDGLRMADTETPAGGSATSESFTYDLADGEGLLSDSNYAFVYGPDGTVEQASLASGAAEYLVADPTASVRGVVASSTGYLTAWTTYDSYGNPETPPTSNGVSTFPGLTELTPLSFEQQYSDPSALTTDGSVLTDNATGISSGSAGVNEAGALDLFWDHNAWGTAHWWKECAAKRGTLLAAGGTPGSPCNGFFYKQGDHGDDQTNCKKTCTLQGNPWDLYAIDWQAQFGDSIHAQLSGHIRFAGASTLGNCGYSNVTDTYGNELVVKYSDGIWAWYCHLSSFPAWVKAGAQNTWFPDDEVLATSGKSGFTCGIKGGYYFNKKCPHEGGLFADHVHVGFGYHGTVTAGGIASMTPMRQAKPGHALFNSCPGGRARYFTSLAAGGRYHSCR